MHNLNLFKNNSRRLILTVAIASVVLVGALLTLVRPAGKARIAHPGSVSTTAQSMPRIAFFGSVTDEDGAPVEGARVQVLVWKVPLGTPPPDTKPGAPQPPRLGEYLDTKTGVTGKFVLTDLDGFVLQVVDVRKQGYDLVFDWGWTLDKNHENRMFVYGGGFPHYIPDEQRPAIFPLHREGSNSIGMPSRGGSDELPDGSIRRNEARRPIIPSTGPGAPSSDEERYERLDALKRAAMKPSTK